MLGDDVANFQKTSGNVGVDSVGLVRRGLTRSLLNCKRECLDEPRCRSIEYIPLNSNIGHCQLYGLTTSDPGARVEVKSDSDNYVRLCVNLVQE